MFNFFKPININEKVAQYEQTQDAVLLDVRTAEEYAEGHIENSINIPVDEISRVQNVVKDKNTPVFVYCLSGGRASGAVLQLQQMGYTIVINSGGIMSYNKKVVI